MDYKVCYKCSLNLPAEEFYKISKIKSGLSSRCKKCNREYSKYWAQTPQGKLKYKNGHLVARYGISLDIYNKMSEEQNGCCKICGIKENLHVDHCHSTGKIRGLLCFTCNAGLGNFKDNLETLEKAVTYLRSQ